MSSINAPHGLTEDDCERFRWILAQFRSAPVDAQGARIFDLDLALPPAKSIEESLDLARRPFINGKAATSCFVPLRGKRSAVRMVACEPVAVKGYEGFKFGVHLEPDHRFRWHVTELSTGASITGHCPTREAAIAKATERLGKDTPSGFQQKLDSWRRHAYAEAARLQNAK